MSLHRYSGTHGVPPLPNLGALQQHHAPNPNSARSASNGSGRIVVVNGFPGTGKFTILKRLQEYLPSDRTCLLDNHLLIDPVTVVIPDRSDRHHELRRSIRAPIFAELGKRAKYGDTILMTACLGADNQRDEDFLQEHLDIARKNGVPMYWINLHCDTAILERRLSTPERQQGSKTKLTDVDVLRNILENNRLLQPGNVGDARLGFVFESLDVSGELEFNVSRLMGIIEKEPRP
ncbi:hypothetical protein HYE67_006891 [Fusarium culmorum]|uniref:Chloramphenicol phosphotransferase-like protein n=1 Tax=Fusarium culmorum TaxID=5516 RepID=A0A2T4H2A1_FUSCU|nr:hypothetical protein FCULG_00007932 [Fusarium culmorum]QPC64660.1 hypothetical protein HYE67_006891 [Fusarium culmorum]